MTDTNNGRDPKVAPFPGPKEREAIEKKRFAGKNAQAGGEPALNLPPVVKALCSANVAVFLLTELALGGADSDALYPFTFVPARYFAEGSPGFAGLVSPFTHMFIHGGWLHLAVNVGTLMAFGAGLEKKIGGRRLLLLYFLCGLLGAGAQVLVYPEMEAPMVGASGAISGLFGAVLILMREEGAMGAGRGGLLLLAAVWIGVSVLFGFFGMPGTDAAIAWIPHVAGFVSGLLLYRPIRRLKIQH